MRGGIKWLMFLSHSKVAREIIENHCLKFRKLKGVRGMIAFDLLMKELGKVYRERGGDE